MMHNLPLSHLISNFISKAPVSTLLLSLRRHSSDQDTQRTTCTSISIFVFVIKKAAQTSDKETQHVREGGPSGFGESGQAIKINQIVTVRDAKSVMNMK